jgi:phosphoenolpyruvate synthase/pyruvate phosphate dikinase
LTAPTKGKAIYVKIHIRNITDPKDGNNVNAKKYVYFFGDGTAEGSARMKSLLGSKGANLAEMTNIGIPVPPGFTISTEACIHYYANDGYPAGLEDEINENLARLEESTKKQFGDAKNPLLLSVRSGAAISMPGMMDTVLNIGLTDESVAGIARMAGNERFAYDSYRRFVQMFGNVVLGMEHSDFEQILEEKKRSRGVTAISSRFSRRRRGRAALRWTRNSIRMISKISYRDTRNWWRKRPEERFQRIRERN